MLGQISDRQIEYVLYHLNYNFKVTPEIRDRLRFVTEGSPLPSSSGNIVFKLSDKEYSGSYTILIDDIPILFPIGENNTIYSWENGSIVFHHDILKSAFYLLSGYQETSPSGRDKLNRFPYEGSVQQRLGIINKPIVNYYFRYLEEGISSLCEKEGIPFQKNRIFKNLGFMLSHDVDVVDTYTFQDLIYRLKQVLNLAPRKSRRESQRYFWRYLVNYLNIFNRPNPHWDFDYLVSTARRFGFSSVFYFLHKDIRHKDSYYRFEDKRIRKLFHYLAEKDCEIGLHGSTRSSSDIDVLREHYQKLKRYSGAEVSGIRQHRLIHIHPTTAQLHSECGLLYDSSLGFAEHEGFRNSFCLPFKLYDFQKDEMIDLWEIPLVVMDATLYMYRNLDPSESLNSVKQITEEIQKFNGLFTLLWHNGNFNEEYYPGAKELFEHILEVMKEKNCDSVSGESCIKNHVIPIFEGDN